MYESRQALPTDREESLWYRDGIIYEVHVRSFKDGDGDGVGDFKGLTGKLDYLRDLGVTVLWLLPFCPSPLRDGGYDISDYCGVHPAYGNMDDFRRFLDAAHGRGLRVITELVVNHTSDQHPWFQRARRANAGSPERDFYVWSDRPDRYEDARIIFKDFETSNWSWDPVALAFYWHRFYAHQPDLNFDNPHVREAVFRVVDFWFEAGVDGLRLDAVPYLFEREGTICENLPETLAFLKALRSHVDQRYKGRVLLAEANQQLEDSMGYFGGGQACHMAFHFPLMPRLFMALLQEDCRPVQEILARTPQLPGGCQWALFLRNHDELTLEMVTAEERDLMYRAFARDPRMRLNLGIRRRLAPLLEGDRRKIELMNVLLFTLPGTPVLYYGDEIGMGDDIGLEDRDGLRTPMQWDASVNGGFSDAREDRLYLPMIQDPGYIYKKVNVEAQQADPGSFYHWMQGLISLRKRSSVFGRGYFEMLPVKNPKIIAYLRRLGEETVLVTANLSSQAQKAHLNLADRMGRIPENARKTGQMQPPSKRFDYTLNLEPYGYSMFRLAKPGTAWQPVPERRYSNTILFNSGHSQLMEPAQLIELDRRLLETG
ncbi:MAG: maltose alpha-D-glucosyltransferase [Planctomycetota bacterium]